MGVDYYKILQVSRNANDDDLKRAYLRLGLEEFDDSKFKILSDAFDVLSDPQKRAVYDHEEGSKGQRSYNREEGSKGQVPAPGAGSNWSNMNMYNSRSTDMSNSRRDASLDWPNMYPDMSNSRRDASLDWSNMYPDMSNSRRDAGSDGPNMYRSDRFQDMSNRSRGVGSDGPNMYGSNRRSFFQDRGSNRRSFFQDRGSNRHSPYGIFQEFFKSSGPFGGRQDRGVFFGSMPMRKGAAIERTLPCSLEDLHNGTTKKMKITNNVTDATGKPATTSEILTIKIMPGWKKGTKITFSEKGNRQHGVIPSDLVFIIDEKPHSVFKRVGDDLIATRKISLAEASTGYTAQLTTLDGRSLTIPFSSGISPTYEEVIKGEGMPFSKEPTRKGNLIIKFDIE